MSGLASYTAGLLGPWVWMCALVSVVSFGVSLAIRFWVYGCGIRLAKRARAREESEESHPVRQRFVAGFVRGLVRSAAILSGVFGKVAGGAAIVACVGILSTYLSSQPLSAPTPAQAGLPALAVARQALRRAAPDAYADAADLGTPEVNTKGDTTTFTFTVSGDQGVASAKKRSYTVTVGPDGVKVGETP